MHLKMPFTQALMLGLGTWLLYVTDRILDGLQEPALGALRERHHFHARHRTAFLATASLLAILLAWSVLTRMGAEALRDDSWILVCALLYMSAVHGRGVSRTVPRLPKELAVAILFSAATAVPAWCFIGNTHRAGSGREQLVPAVFFFALLCWMNCVGIKKWEGAAPFAARAVLHPSTRWAGLHLRLIVTLIAFFSIPAAILAPSRALMAVYLAALLSSALLLALDACSSRLSPLHVRIAADAALLTPLAFYPLAH